MILVLHCKFCYSSRLCKEFVETDAELPKGINMEYKDSKNAIDPLKLLKVTNDQPNTYELIIRLSTSQTEYSQQNNIKILEKKGEYKLKVVKQTLERGTESIMLLNIYGKIEKYATDKKCVVCIANPADCFLFPCRHLILCTSCINKVISELNPRNNPCPLCRTSNIQYNHRHYLHD